MSQHYVPLLRYAGKDQAGKPMFRDVLLCIDDIVAVENSDAGVTTIKVRGIDEWWTVSNRYHYLEAALGAGRATAEIVGRMRHPREIEIRTDAPNYLAALGEIIMALTDVLGDGFGGCMYSAIPDVIRTRLVKKEGL